MISVGSTTSTSFVDKTGLSAAQIYYYTVSAYDAASNYSSPSSMAAVTTPPVTTPPTVGLQSSGSPSIIGQAVTFTATLRLTSGSIPNGEAVVFNDGGAQIGSGTTSGGVAVFSTAFLAVGSHSVTATYGGDGVYQASTSSAVNQLVTKNVTTTTLTSALNPSSYGQSVTLMATVTSAGSTPTGTVTFKNGAAAIGSVTLANGVASFSTTTLPTGTNSITVANGGDPSSLSSTSPALNQVVTTGTITLTLKSSVNPSTPNQQLTLTATLTVPNGGNPTGTITFLQNGSVIGSPVTVAARQASITTSFPSVGTYPVTAMYSGDANFISVNTPQSLNQVIAATSTTTTVKSSGSPATVGNTITFTVTVHPTSGTIPDGDAVTFSDGGTAIGAGVTSGGIAYFATSSLAVGTHSITANYAGDASDTPSTSAALSQIISKNATTTTLMSNLNPSSYGQSVILTATVTSAGSTPTGTVTFKNGAAAIGQATLVDGVGVLTTATLPVGTSSITVIYGGDGYSNSNTSPALNQVVNMAATTTVVTSSMNPSAQGKSVKFTASVSSATAIPTGTVTFTQGATILGTINLASGNAGLTTAALPSGSDVITATYNATANFTSSFGMLTQAVI